MRATPMPTLDPSRNNQNGKGHGGSTDIGGYFYGEQTLCAECVKDIVVPFYRIADSHRSAEDILNEAARRVGIDRADESSFNSREFPKAIYAPDLIGDDYCFVCLRPL